MAKTRTKAGIQRVEPESKPRVIAVTLEFKLFGIFKLFFTAAREDAPAIPSVGPRRWYGAG